jgi:methylated-DNA-[protein]-cysteine S-methyltransferase
MNAPTRLLFDVTRTPIGHLGLVTDEQGRLRATGFTDGHARMERWLRRRADSREASLVETRNPAGVTDAIDAYFAGDLAALDELAVFTEGTPFQESVWAALRAIPGGTTISYAELARRIGRPKAVRAVGLANGANPIGVVVPCHRVIGADGSLTGYGGGVERKRWLIDHEQRATGARLAV